MGAVAATRLTRGQFLRVAGGCAAGLALPAGAYGASAWPRRPVPLAAQAGAALSGQFRSFVSRPDLRPPPVQVRGSVSAQLAAAQEGYYFLAPSGESGAQAGPLIVDAAGEPAWFAPVKSGAWATNFRVQQYGGKPVLTWWEGIVQPIGYGQGEGVILDTSYREIARVRAGRGRQADLHEFLLTPEGTALITCFPETVNMDLRRIGGPSHGPVLESIIQEIDVRTGRVLLEWRSLKHTSIYESYLPQGGTYDYLHINSIDVTPDGRLLVSGRHTCALYKLARRSGRVLWRLGGKHSHFAMARGTRFAWQHDARHLPDGSITVFDDGAGPRRSHHQSRGLALQVDRTRKTVRLAGSYRHPHPLLAYAMGSMQTLANGNVVVAWGNVSVLSEFARDGTWLTDAKYPFEDQSYRGYHLPWSATPTAPPAAATATVDATTTLYASWNGATQVSAWLVSVGPSPGALSSVGITPRAGFETAIPLSASTGYAMATALDSSGHALANSNPVKL